MSRRSRRLEAAFLFAVIALCGIYGLSLWQDARQKLVEHQKIGELVRSEAAKKEWEREEEIRELRRRMSDYRYLDEFTEKIKDYTRAFCFDPGDSLGCLSRVVAWEEMKRRSPASANQPTREAPKSMGAPEW